MDALKALQSLGLGPETEGPGGEKLIQQAQQIWSMLDDMAGSDPEAYKRFIEKQTKEHQEMLTPPQPHMCVKTKFQDGMVLYVNVVSWAVVPAPKSRQDSIPLYAAPLDIIPDGKKASASSVAIATNLDVLVDCGMDAKDPEERREFITLCLDYTEHLCKRKISRDYTVLPQNTLFKGDLDKAQNFFVKSFKKAMSKDKTDKHDEQPNPKAGNEGLGGSSLMDQLSNITVSSCNSKSQAASCNNCVIPPITLTDTNKSAKPNKKNLIQEIGGEDVKLQEPLYRLVQSPEGDSLVLTVELPGVTSVADCQLDISEDDVKLYVEGKYDLTVKLPSCIDDSQARAKFSRKQSTLTLHMPTVESRFIEH